MADDVIAIHSEGVPVDRFVVEKQANIIAITNAEHLLIDTKSFRKLKLQIETPANNPPITVTPQFYTKLFDKVDGITKADFHDGDETVIALATTKTLTPLSIDLDAITAVRLVIKANQAIPLNTTITAEILAELLTS